MTAVLAIAAPASAGGPTREDLGSFPYDFVLDCSPYGFGFHVETHGVETLSVATFTDREGSPTRVVIHDGFQETDTNSVTGKTLDFAGNDVETYDLAAGTRTVVGRVFLMTDPNAGIVIQDVGRIVFSAPYVVAFAAGHHQVLYGDVDELVCAALATP